MVTKQTTRKNRITFKDYGQRDKEAYVLLLFLIFVIVWHSLGIAKVYAIHTIENLPKINLLK